MSQFLVVICLMLRVKLHTRNVAAESEAKKSALAARDAALNIRFDKAENAPAWDF